MEQQETVGQTCQEVTQFIRTAVVDGEPLKHAAEYAVECPKFATPALRPSGQKIRTANVLSTAIGRIPPWAPPTPADKFAPMQLQEVAIELASSLTFASAFRVEEAS